MTAAIYARRSSTTNIGKRSGLAECPSNTMGEHDGQQAHGITIASCRGGSLNGNVLISL
jgi:hypothetical protein